jgi:hypothetical protein
MGLVLAIGLASLVLGLGLTLGGHLTIRNSRPYVGPNGTRLLCAGGLIDGVGLTLTVSAIAAWLLF